MTTESTRRNSYRIAAALATIPLLVTGLAPAAGTGPTAPIRAEWSPTAGITTPTAAKSPTLKLSKKKVVSGATVTLTGTVKGVKAKQKVTLEVKQPGAPWAKAGTKRTNRKGKVKFTPRPVLGKSKYRIVTTVRTKTLRSRAVAVTGTLKVAPTGALVLGQRFTVSGTLRTTGKRPVILQGLRAGKWRTLAKGKSTAKGAFIASVSFDGVTKVRVRAPKAKVKKQRLAAFTSPAVAIKSRTQQAKVATEPIACTAEPIELTVTATTFGARRDVRVQIGVDGGSWTDLVAGTTSPAGVLQLSATAPATADKYGVRVLVAASGQIPAMASPTEIIEVVECGGLPAPEPPVVAAGGDHTCALNAAGEIWCWGDNRYRQRGAGDPDEDTTPVKVPSGVKFKDVAAGNSLSCGLDTTGRAHCWGTYTSFNTGRDQDHVRTIPTAEGGSRKFSRLAVGQYHACGIANAGQVWCWGLKKIGPTAGGSLYQFQDAPVLVPGNRRYVEIAASNETTCALSTSGERWCWQGIGPADTFTSGVYKAHGDKTFATFSNSCGIDHGGEAYCWGSDLWGLLGDGPGGPASSAEPVAVTGGHTFSSIASKAGGTSTACGITTQGRAHCWGYGAYGQIGDGYTTSRVTPTETFFIGPTRTFKQISVGSLHVCAVRDEGVGVYCWGSNRRGQLGSGSISPLAHNSQPGLVPWP